MRSSELSDQTITLNFPAQCHHTSSSPISPQYLIEITSRHKTYIVRRRYSDFEQLRLQLQSEFLQSDPNSKILLPSLPPKTSGVFGYLTGSSNLLSNVVERQTALERWLKTLIVNKDLREATRQSPSLKRFLEYKGDDDDQKSDQPLFTPQTWLVEHNELRSSIREIYSSLDNRSLDSKRQLVNVSARVGKLLTGLQQLSQPGTSKAVISAGELDRRARLVTSLQDDCEKLGKLTINVRGGINGSQRPADQRAELLTTRVLGGGGSGRNLKVVEETNETRALDNRSLMAQISTDKQDDRLRSLTEILQRQKTIGLLINQELVEQNELLDQVSDQLDGSSKKLKLAKKQMDRLGA